MVTPLARAGQNPTLVEQIDQLKAENQQLRQQIIQLQEQKQQAIAQKQAVYLVKTVDKTTHLTTIRSYERALTITHGRKQRYWYQIQTRAPGSTPGSVPQSGPGDTLQNANPSPSVEIQMQLRAPTSQGQLGQIKKLMLEVDGQKMALPVIKHTARRRRSGVGRTKVRLVNETLILKLTIAQVVQLSQAKTVTGQFSGTRFRWAREDYNLFRALAVELAPVSQ